MTLRQENRLVRTLQTFLVLFIAAEVVYLTQKELWARCALDHHPIYSTAIGLLIAVFGVTLLLGALGLADVMLYRMQRRFRLAEALERIPSPRLGE